MTPCAPDSIEPKADRNCLLSLPKIGSFNVADVKASELEKHLRAQIGQAR